MIDESKVMYVNKSVAQKFDSYPAEVRDKLEKLRSLIFEVAKEEGLGSIEESLRWGEPSYLSKTGSAIRVDWKNDKSEQYSLYFNCNTKLVDTFKAIYPDVFHYSGNREIIFQLDQALPTKELKHCISLALRYHEIKKLPLLGV